MSQCGDPQESVRRGLGIPYGAGVAMLGGGAALLAVERAWSAALDQWLIAQLRLSSAAPLWVVEAWRDLSALGSLAVLCLAVLATTAVLLVGVSRPILGVHWPSDVLAGWLFGLGWALLALRYAARP